MALIVEDGSVVAGAESYVDVAFADLYWSNRNNATWAAATTAQKEAALREAATFLDGSYEWLGERMDSEQAMYWPRSVYVARDFIFVASDTIPTAVKRAQCELALEALGGRLLATLERGGMVQSQKVGSLAVSYFEGAPGNKRYPFIDLIVKELIGSGGTGIMTTSVRA